MNGLQLKVQNLPRTVLSLKKYPYIEKVGEMDRQEQGCILLLYMLVWLFHIPECHSSQQGLV